MEPVWSAGTVSWWIFSAGGKRHTDSDAKDFISGIYGKYDLEYHFDLLGMHFCVVCLVLGAICFKIETFSKTLGKSRDDGTSGTAAPQTQDVPPERSV